MKKILKLFILIIICLPLGVFAKTELVFDWQKEDLMFLHKDNNKYYFGYEFFSEENKIFEYDIEGNKVGEKEFYNDENMNNRDFFKTKDYISFVNLFSNLYEDELIYDAENLIAYEIDYNNEIIESSTFDDNEPVEIGFNDDLTVTKKILGKKYDVYDKVKGLNLNISSINVYDNIYVIYYEDNDYFQHAYVLNKKLELLKDFKTDDYIDRVIVRENDGLIYVMSRYDKLFIYKLDGTLYDTIDISNNLFNNEMTGYCGRFTIYDIDIMDKEILFSYYFSRCEKRMIMKDVSDLAKTTINYIEFLTLKYSFNYEVIKVESSNGKFTYDIKFDEDNNEYVELKITPNKNYSIDKIIVTDINGNEIEVKDNKFIMPMSDVKVEVKYINGEYLPIPDTFLGVSTFSIIFGIIFVVCGSYLMLVMIESKKVEE